MKSERCLPASLLSAFQGDGERLPENIRTLLQEALSALGRKVVVLDDDPTGTQTVHGVSVYTSWDEDSMLSGFQEERSLFYVLTNSRAFSQEKTARVHAEIARNIAHASRVSGRDFVVISRSDSTLRGHYPLETETLRSALEQYTGKRYRGEIIAPFFAEGGRYTMDNVHYVREGEQLVPAGQTEFAQDRTFGYAASHLGCWCEEKTAGAYRAEDMTYIGLHGLRGLEIEAVREQLLQVREFGKIIVNAVDYTDIEVFVTALAGAFLAGGEYLLRTAAAVPRVLGGIHARPLLTREELVRAGDANGGLVLVGSHVGKTTQQLEQLQQSGAPLAFLQFDQHLALQENGLQEEMLRVARAANTAIAAGRTAVVFTRRERLDLPGGNGEEQLRLAVRISDALVGVVCALEVRPRFLIAKGGITSSDVAVVGLGIRRADVLGQIRPGIPVWRTGDECRFDALSLVVFPGNVGEPETLRDCVEQLS